jgi:hypothetical protein
VKENPWMYFNGKSTSIKIKNCCKKKISSIDPQVESDREDKFYCHSFFSADKKVESQPFPKLGS